MKKTVLTLLVTGLLAGHLQAAEKSHQASSDDSVTGQPLRILLVNDDGCQSVGTTSLQEKLAAKGYDVWMVAPSENQSGAGSAITFKPNKIFEVEKVAEKRYCFPGTPADAVDFGLLGILRENPPDLVISGVNDGPNIGPAQLNSGTVSAAARAVRYGYPAIAASIGYVMTPEEMKAGWPQTKKYWPDAVDYVVSLVDKLKAQWQPGTALLPKGSGLSINYPPLPKEQNKGVKYTENSRFPVPIHYYKILENGHAQQAFSNDLFAPPTGDDDASWLSRGYITWTLIDGDWNAPAYEARYRSIFD